MSARTAPELKPEERREVAAWFEANRESLPPPVRNFLDFHRPYLAAGEGNPLRRALDAAVRELRRALHLTPSTEKRRLSGSPLAGIPSYVRAKSRQEQLEARIARGDELADWHRDLRRKHTRRVKKLRKRLARMAEKKADDGATPELEEIPSLEEIELTEEERAETKAATARFIARLQEGDGPDPAMASVNETLMPGGSVLVHEEHVKLPAPVPEELAGARLIETLHEEPPVRYDFSVTVTRLVLEVEKKILEDANGERRVIAPSTREYGPPRSSVTWNALATVAILSGQFALPFNRLGTLLSSPEKRFTAGRIGRLLHYVARRFAPVYLELGRQLSGSDYLAGDDTSCRVLEVSSWFEKVKADPALAKSERPPWSGYATPGAAEQSLQRCQALEEARIRRREDGDRRAGRRTREEMPSLGMLIGRRFPFESPRRNGDGPKESMHTTVVTGRSVAADPKTLIVFYRSHLGSCGNLYESILKGRDPTLKDVVLQGDLSTSNLVTSPELRERFRIRFIGCSAHARRPMALYEDEDPVMCGAMLHLFLGLAMHEQQLDAFGRNPTNVLAVRGNESRELWDEILELAKDMADRWSKATDLGAGARYIINHFEELTAYLEDPRLEPSNTQRERMLRTEKLIQGSSMFRKSLEGRFVLDVVRTILQTAVAAAVPVHQYLVSVLRADPDAVAKAPERFTPRAWAAEHVSAPASPPPKT